LLDRYLTGDSALFRRLSERSRVCAW